MSTITVDVRDLPGKLAELLSQAAAGTDVVIADGEAKARLVPPAAMRPVILNMHPGAMEMAADFNDPLPDEFWGGAFE